ncbi:unnamed protein product [Angiostrongylus costaricensis]|uniref:CDC45-like protein n=1 Tax=Angiostrongylus costaricensis TaxID=334426 RepID=A0A158PK20_ANGCS|nr:unnamed protein product [Angiostrongylus costaricensis]
MVPVSGWDALGRTLREHYEQSPSIVLLNCGGNRSLQDMHIPARSKVYVIDSRRPFHHENIFEGEQIMILVDSAEVPKLNIPKMSDVIEEGDFGESESDDENRESGSAKRGMEEVQQRLLKKEKKKLWSTRRKNLLWKYYENAWYSISTAMRMLELAALLNKATPELMWIAAVGLSSQWTDKVVTTEAYHDVCIDPMYSHWSLYRAMVVNEHFACKTRNWTQKGDSDVKHLLANLGLTLHETRQKFEAMTSTRRKEVMQTLEKEMTPPFASFIAHFGYSNRVSAADVARGMAVRLESPRRTPLVDRFESARDILNCFMKSHQNFSPLVKCFDVYKIGLECVWTLVGSAVNQQEVLPLGPFFLHSSTHPLGGFNADNVYSTHRILLRRDNGHGLKSLEYTIHARFLAMPNAPFLQKAFATVRRSRDRTTKPIVVSLALHGDMRGWHIVTGVMPLDTIYKDALMMSFLGRAFERAAEQAGIDVRRDCFDPNVVLIRSEDRSRFFDLLQAVMEIES